MSTVHRGGVSTTGEEEMEDHGEFEEDSTSNVTMFAAGGTFIPATTDTTVTEVRNSAKHHRASENVSEDLLNRHIQEYGLVSPERAKMLCRTSSGNTIARSCRVEMTISSWRNMSFARSV